MPESCLPSAHFKSSYLWGPRNGSRRCDISTHAHPDGATLQNISKTFYERSCHIRRPRTGLWPCSNRAAATFLLHWSRPTDRRSSSELAIPRRPPRARHQRKEAHAGAQWGALSQPNLIFACACAQGIARVGARVVDQDGRLGWRHGIGTGSGADDATAERIDAYSHAGEWRYHWEREGEGEHESAWEWGWRAWYVQSLVLCAPQSCGSRYIVIFLCSWWHQWYHLGYIHWSRFELQQLGCTGSCHALNYIQCACACACIYDYNHTNTYTRIHSPNPSAAALPFSLPCRLAVLLPARMMDGFSAAASVLTIPPEH